MKKKLTNYDELLLNYLKTPRNTAGFLTEILADYSEDDDVSQRVLLAALGDIIQARGGFSEMAKETGLDKAYLHQIFSEDGNPRLGTLKKIFGVLGFEMELKIAPAPMEEVEEETETDEQPTSYSTV